MVEKQVSFLDSESRFLSHIQNIFGIVQDNQASVAVVGGIALRASMNLPVEFRRTNGTTPDIDMIGLGPTPTILSQTKKEIKKYHDSQPDCPSVNFESAKFSKEPQKYYQPFEFLSGIRRDPHGEFYLTFRGIDQQIPYQTMDVIPRQYGQVKIFTPPQETILHRYEARMGIIKPKDKHKTEAFRQFIEKNGGDGLDPKLYESYLIFCQRINQEYPNIIKLNKWWWNFDLKHGGKFSGSSGFLYDLTKIFHR